MSSVFDVAKYILTTVGGDISTMKLQKLCYYSQAWNLVCEGIELFKEDFIKWDNGPVCVELFNCHRGLFYINGEVIPDSLLSDERLSEKESLNIEQILEDYGKHTGVQLSELTHSEDPWKNASKNEVITKDSMRKYYSSLISSDAQ